MKLTNYILSLLLISLSFIACETEDNDDGTSGAESKTGTYQLYMNDSLISEGSVDEVGMVQGLDKSYQNIVSMNRGTIMSFMISGFSYTVGEEVTLNDDSDDEAVILFNAWDILHTDREEVFFSQSGTLTRTSSSKISFEGVCYEMYDSATPITFRGYYESDAFKQIR